MPSKQEWQRDDAGTIEGRQSALWQGRHSNQESPGSCFPAGLDLDDQVVAAFPSTWPRSHLVPTPLALGRRYTESAGKHSGGPRPSRSAPPRRAEELGPRNSASTWPWPRKPQGSCPIHVVLNGRPRTFSISNLLSRRIECYQMIS